MLKMIAGSLAAAFWLFIFLVPLGLLWIVGGFLVLPAVACAEFIFYPSHSVWRAFQRLQYCWSWPVRRALDVWLRLGEWK